MFGKGKESASFLKKSSKKLSIISLLLTVGWAALQPTTRRSNPAE
jgi:hypothetical protein